MAHRPPFRVLLGHGQVRDQKGEEMHKSKGNAIPFNGAADDGYELFVERNAKLKPEEQARRELPEGWLSVREGEARIENRQFPALFATYPPMGADIMRWLYCRQNPALNVNFGPTPADEVRSRFVLKLWNTYAFFCNYARLDGFDPKASPVPVTQRPDIDRWILSDLQLLVRTARQAFESFNVMAFCVEAEQFVDDRLSNWYVRRNRRRFWKSEKGADKQAAYQTLYAVLMTLAKLFAPIMPFLSESMYQNLAEPGKKEASVHLEDYPVVDESLIDADLSADIDALLRLVSLGSAARNSVRIRVRQPLAEMKVQPGDERERRAVERFGDQIREELNIKRVTLHDPSRGSLLQYEIKPNPKTLGPKLGPRLKEVQAALARLDPAEVAKRVQAGQTVDVALADSAVGLEPGDLFVVPKVQDGWAGSADRGTQVAIDTRISEALAQEGMAREVVRHVQNVRRDAGLEMEDRIELYLATDSPELRQAIDAHREYIMVETLTVKWATEPLGEGAFRTDVKVDGHPLHIELRKVAA